MSSVTSARLLACEVGRAVRERGAFARNVLDARLRGGQMSRADREFARVLALGVAATWGTLDEVIDRCLDDPAALRPNVRDCLRVSTYEIVFLRKDAYAAVDQGVNLVRSVERRATGFANAVLRRVAAAAEGFPFGDPAADDAALARSCGFPLPLARALIAQMGRDGAARFMAASNAQAPVYLGVNAVKARHGDVERQFEAAGHPLAPVGADAFGLAGAGVVPGCYRVDDPAAVATRTAERLLREGAVIVSDAASQHVAALALPARPPRSFLEVGFGRGTKTVLLQSGAQRRWGRQMELFAVDDDSFKVGVLRKRAETCGIDVKRIVQADARDLSGQLGRRRFDAVFVDAPCSGLGTLRRHPEIRWRMTAAQVNELADTGLALLREAARRTADGGQLTYATCTVLAQENEFVIKRFLATPEGEGFKIAPYGKAPDGSPVLFFKSVLAPEGCDAHFAARLIRA